MVRAETYFENDEIKVHLFKDDTNQAYFISGKKAYEFIEQFYTSKILKFYDNNRDILFSFDNCQLNINEYEKIFQSERLEKLFSPIYLNIKKFLEAKKINELKKKRVVRRNKYTRIGIIAVGITASILASIHANALNVYREYAYTEQYTPVISSEIEKSKVASDFSGLFDSLKRKVETDAKEISEKVVDNINTLNNDDDYTQQIYTDNFMTKTNLNSQYRNNSIVKDMNVETISINYEDRTSTDKAKISDSNYRSVIEKYSKMYGVDPNLMLAIATQESGDHYNNINFGPAVGLMQIEKSVWKNGGDLTAYNFETNSWETITITSDGYNDFINNLSDLDYNVKVGCMIFQQSLIYMDYNILASIQCYNMGYGNMQTIFDNYCADTGLTKQQVLENQFDCGWLNYRNIIPAGDSKYIEHVLSYYGENCSIKNIKPDGTIVNVIVNNNTIEKVY